MGVQVYEEAFAKMQAATGISDIDELVENFINAEDQNFSLFTYANELSGDIEKHEAEIADLKGQLESLKGTGGGPVNAEKQKMFGELEEKWSKIDKMAEHYELKYQQSAKTLTAVRAGIQSVFNRLHTKSFGPPDMSAVSEGNMIQYLGIIEGRISEILNVYNSTQTQEGDDEEPAQPQPRPAGGAQLTISPEYCGRLRGRSAAVHPRGAQAQDNPRYPEEAGEEQEDWTWTRLMLLFVQLRLLRLTR